MIFSYILKAIWCINMILWANVSVWLDAWPQNKSWSVWPLFNGSVILAYILKTIWCIRRGHWPGVYVSPCSLAVVFYVSKLQYHEVSLVTINQQTSYDFGILRQDDRIVKCLPMNQMRFADYVTIWVVHLPKGWAELPHRTRLCGPCIAALAGYSLVVAFVNTKTDFPEGIVVDWVGVNYIPMVSSFSFVCFVHSNLQANLHFFPFTSLFSATHQNFLYSTSNFHSKSLTIDTIKRFKIHKSITIIVRSQKSAILQIDHVIRWVS